MQTDPNAKQLIVERIKSTTNILVTVSRNPSVDELSAALGLTLMLNKMDKHATAVFSGAVPPAIEFLEPQKTFENTTDSLRDFIIALDKEKADRLRYKVEEDVVRIFITPYRTKITDKDLNFSQGDFNVELIVALGVEKREDIDTAVTAHGRILHDATVVTINSKDEKSSVGSIDWSDPSSSSLCEMLMSLSEALQTGLLDQQISTALLTGIVSATDRFRNEHTSPKVMTMAAQLMAAGANQQLIATKLEERHELNTDTDAKEKPKSTDGTTRLKEGESEKVSKDDTPIEEPKKDDGEMTIDHGKEQPVEPTPEAPQPEPEETPEEPDSAAEAELEAKLDAVMAAPAPADELKKDLLAASEAATNTPAETSSETSTDAPEPPIKGMSGSWRDRPVAAPSFGGTLNATADMVDEDRSHDGSFGGDQPILSHSPVTGTPPPQFDQPAEEVAPVEPLTEAIKSEPESQLSYEPLPEPHEEPVVDAVPAPASPTPEVAVPEAPAPVAIDDARAAVDAALNAMPFNPAGQPLQSVGAQPLGEEIRAVEPAPVMPVEPMAPPAMEPVAPVAVEPTPVAPPAMPPLPDFSTLPPLPGQPEQAPHPAMTDPSLSQDTTVTVPTDPSQFQIPGSK